MDTHAALLNGLPQRLLSVGNVLELCMLLNRNDRSVHVKIRITAGYVTTRLGKLQFGIKPVLESYSVLHFIQGTDRSFQIVQSVQVCCQQLVYSFCTEAENTAERKEMVHLLTEQ